MPTIDADVLTVLARTEAPLTGRRVTALSRRGSQPAVQAILSRLVAHGVALAEPAGRAVLYTLNRDHLLASAVISAVTARETLLNRLREQIDDWSIKATHTSLFGSTARREATTESDIDVLVVRPQGVASDDPEWGDQLADLERRVAGWTGNQLAWFETDQSTLARGAGAGEPLLDELRTDSVHLTGVRLEVLMAPAASDNAGSR